MQEKLSIEVVEVKLSPADRLYASHLRAVQAYQLRNPEKIKDKGRKHMEKLKSDPEKYALYLEKMRCVNKKARLKKMKIVLFKITQQRN